MNLDLLLGIQNWRKFKLDNPILLGDKILTYDKDSEERLLLEYL